jgi:hypothetical protein
LSSRPSLSSCASAVVSIATVFSNVVISNPLAWSGEPFAARRGQERRDANCLPTYLAA